MAGGKRANFFRGISRVDGRGWGILHSGGGLTVFCMHLPASGPVCDWRGNRQRIVRIHREQGANVTKQTKYA
jgi:hypothetical protein